MFEYDVNGYHVIVNKVYAVIDGKEIEVTPSSFLEITVTEE